jgi:hypothetical protein
LGSQASGSSRAIVHFLIALNFRLLEGKKLLYSQLRRLVSSISYSRCVSRNTNAMGRITHAFRQGLNIMRRLALGLAVAAAVWFSGSQAMAQHHHHHGGHHGGYHRGHIGFYGGFGGYGYGGYGGYGYPGYSYYRGYGYPGYVAPVVPAPVVPYYAPTPGYGYYYNSPSYGYRFYGYW